MGDHEHRNHLSPTTSGKPSSRCCRRSRPSQRAAPPRPRPRRPRRHRLRPAHRLPVAAAAQELGCGSGITCWRRLRDWQEAGVWERLHETAAELARRRAAIDWSRASLDSLSVRAKRGASRPAPTRPTAASPAPSTTWSSTATASRSPSGSRPPTPTTRPSCSRSSTPSRRSSARAGDRGVLASARPSCTPTRPTTPPKCAAPCAPAASPRASPAVGSSRASGWGGTAGWSSARFAWLLGCRRLGVRYERRADLLQGLLHLACALTCLRFLSASRRNSVP